MLRHLVETGAVRRGGERWVVTNIQEIAVPEGVRNVVGRRLSELSPGQRHAASAAVIGRSISLDVLAAVSPNTEDENLDALDEAVRARLLEETGPEEYRFAAVLRPVDALRRAVGRRKRRAHRRVADALEKLHPDDVAVLAYHSVEAGPDGGDLSRAVGYVLATAERAQDSRRWPRPKRSSGWRSSSSPTRSCPTRCRSSGPAAGSGNASATRATPATGPRCSKRAAWPRPRSRSTCSSAPVLSNSRGITSIVGAVDEERVALTEAAVEAIAPGPSADPPDCWPSSPMKSCSAGDDDRRLALADEAEALARSSVTGVSWRRSW